MTIHLDIADTVTSEHVATFVEELLRRTSRTEAFDEAFAAAGLIQWPEDRPSQIHFHDVTGEICEKTINGTRPALVEAFLVAATAVLDRERRRVGQRAVMHEARPFFEVAEHGTGRTVSVIVWNVRAIYETEVAGETVTRIEYSNGDVLDSTTDASLVLDLFRYAAR